MKLNNIEGNINYLVRRCHENVDDIDIDNVKNQLESLTTEKDYWALFKKRFNEADKEFQDSLARQYPQLTKKDLFFCSLIKLKLPYKDIAMLMQVSPESIVKKKYRIKQRMEIQTEQELENALQEAVV
jgi:DNA-binding CsgD family transcriptional regulator